MISADDLAALVRAYNPRSDGDLIRRAYAYAEEMHRGQVRRSGEPYFMHPVEVAGLLTEQHLDDATIACALLHDTIEDTRASYDEVERRFGTDIARLVDGVTKLTKIELNSAETRQAENFRKLFMAMAEDLRVILVKLADRLHNMRTIKHVPPEKQVVKARETMDIYAPLAGRMGMQWMREELEDLAFAVLNPDGRNSILRRFVRLQRESGDVIRRITADIEHELWKAGIEAEVQGRAKRAFSIWRKMEEKGIGFSRLSDIYGFRIVTHSAADCYAALGAVHQRWTLVPGRFKDYISQPKSNGYRSIHTTVLGRDGKRVEVQIRTREMHEVAERGVAAHWSYRDGVRTANRFAVDPAVWLRQMTERFEESADHAEFLEAVKLEMYTDQVFCFTPKGEVVKLPRGATPIDFAYAIHTNLGHRTVAAKIDGIRVPLWTRLKNGQSVEVVTAAAQTPQATWIDIATTGRAKSAIRRALKAERRVGHVRLGRELARAAFAHMGKRATEKALRTAADALGYDDDEDLLAAIGASQLTARRVVETLYPELAHGSPVPDVDPARAIVGVDPRAHYDRAPCCQPVPGERIVGIANRGRGVQVHAIDCPRMVEFEDQPERWIDLQWAPGHHAASHAVTVDLTISNDAGVLGRICTLIGEQNANISDLRFIDRKPDFFRLLLDMDVRDAEHLHAVLMAVDSDSDVARAARHRETAAAVAAAQRTAQPV
ncbi:bifunctional (p)ppGpp synthetase/guanosine-3',5'-bis(diphosphate) 3'-pyrophosphohydrolase [Jannaschia sp. W003]|uniref:RelA/SpoT family protein n=1 Tax=Jannaschia sp. W003 TaxID=2867012 RepID=UPI0021A2A6FD|nr:bifunctional (p)ppGpp synthetase/guanosine-3',5'-bis(diphosphate) 3'-pyrophosphohydrolase [Jannaschia sp. W003]UWQ22890.1 bifunctional (p)ppGpp synthetase/guanosine-3',5'-bis(diphosphate) 3'-pyrophosphohydrolase [Jannaschia sp. W003]